MEWLGDLSDDLTEEEIRQRVQEAFEKRIEATHRNLRRNRQRIVPAERRIRRDFERRLGQRYRHAFNLFDLFLITCRNMGAEYNREHRERTAQEQDYVSLALTRIHARACLVSSEIRALLVSGHPSGALARWRTLHELAVVASFIKVHGPDVAERYILHERVITAREAEKYVKHSSRLKHAPYPTDDLEDLRKTKRELVERFGSMYEKDYGWAAEVMSGKPDFSRIEESIDMDHWRPYVGMASHSVHAGFKGMTFDVGHFQSTANDIMLAGPSNSGLIEAGDCTLIDMNNCTITFLSYRPTPDSGVQIAVLNKLVKECRDVFFNAHQQLVRDEEAIRAESESGVPPHPKLDD